jgi:hypothetical protein
MKRHIALAGWMFCISGCPEPAAETAVSQEYEIQLAAGVPVRLTLPVERSFLMQEREGGARFEREGLILRVQAVPASGEETAARTPASVAAAIARRFELGEQQGDLASQPCRFAGQAGQCVIGTFSRDGTPWIRRGAFVAASGQVLWVDVCGPADRVQEVDAWANELSSQTTLQGAT